MAPRSAQKEALSARDLLLCAMKKTLAVVVGGYEVEVVGVAHEDVGALLDCDWMAPGA